MYEYDRDFYNYINQGSVDSAKHILPIVKKALADPIDTVLDVGCGAGAWLSVWKSLGADVTGLDGAYLNTDQLMIDATEFLPVDLNTDFDLGTRFSLVQSLEVAEHLPENSANSFVASLCRHGDIVMFSAAPPGQGGENHINEKPYEYWQKLFNAHGYDMYDPIRQTAADKVEIKPWYRYNTFLYVNRLASTATREALSDWRVAEAQLVQDISPPLYRLRKLLLRALPSRIVTHLAILKKRHFGR
ncbi:MAG: methyltransferase domain-containing protein [Halieaceae bacterium]